MEKMQSFINGDQFQIEIKSGSLPLSAENTLVLKGTINALLMMSKINYKKQCSKKNNGHFEMNNT